MNQCQFLFKKQGDFHEIFVFNFQFAAAHCIKGTSLVRSGYTVDFVRLGEHDLRTQIDCEDVSVCLSFDYIFIKRRFSFGLHS